eukprot:447462-Prorocentrum_minimum.AAC.3
MLHVSGRSPIALHHSLNVLVRVGSRTAQSARRVRYTARSAPKKTVASLEHEVVGSRDEADTPPRQSSWVDQTRCFVKQVGKEVNHNLKTNEGMLDPLVSVNHLSATRFASPFVTHKQQSSKLDLVA